MRARASHSFRTAGMIFGSLATVIAFASGACTPAPVVVTDADQALQTRPNPTAVTSTSTTPPSTAKPPPLEVPDQVLAELPPFSCPPDKQLDLLGQTFCVLTDLHDWHTAEAQCQKIGAHLATMKNASLANALREALKSPADVESFWIGLAEPNEERWIWSNGTPMRFSAFRRGEPNNQGGEDCAEWLVQDGQWNDANCFQPRSFVCEAPAVPAGSRAKRLTCNGKRITVEKTDYCIEAPARWDVAQRTCVANGGELAMIDTDAENNALFQALRPRMGVPDLWIGLSDEAIENNFRWISGEPLQTPIWHPGEPNDFGGVEDCVQWVLSDGRWNDLPCHTPRPSLCEKPQSVTGK